MMFQKNGESIFEGLSKLKKNGFLITADIISVLLSLFLSFAFIYYSEKQVVLTEIINHNTLYYVLLFSIITLTVNRIFRLYDRLWLYAGIDEALLIAAAALVSTAALALISLIEGRYIAPGVFLLYGGFLTVFTLCSRFYRKLSRSFLRMGNERFSHMPTQRVMLIGAGAAGSLLLKLLQTEYDTSHKRVVCVIDDSPSKIGGKLLGVPVIGGRDIIEHAADKYNINEIILAAPSMAQNDKREILSICGKTRCRLLTLPSIYSILNCEVKLGELRDVRIEDLLDRDPIKLDESLIRGYIHGKRVLVTGGGGSIGSELCRQIAASEPSLLVVLDIYENTAYELELELRCNFPLLNLALVICNICDSEQVKRIFEKFRPETVFHAAAHKHVPLMEDNVEEAVKNNIFGTLNLVRAADTAGVSRFVLISSDKAVRPTNVMGVTKRICEMIVQSYSRSSQTCFVAVRFGNVLGSHGSVVPLFRDQIARGGPVCVTHPDITRYFMTIAEAVSLVLEAGACAAGGEIFVLDMGKPIKIVDLARNMIRLSGFVPEEDIKIEFIGLRPGEKLYEELLLDRENMIKTQNDLIFVEKTDFMDKEKLIIGLDRLSIALKNEQTDIKQMLCELVPEYNCEYKLPI